MKDKIIDRILSIDVKALTNENKEVIIRYTDFKDLDNINITHDYKNHYNNNFCYKTTLEGFGFDVNCKGYTIEFIETDSIPKKDCRKI